MEAEKREPEASEELEGFVQLMFRVLLVHGAAVPRTVESPWAEHVRALRAERVPIAHCHTEMVFHPLADYEAVFFVISICERVDGIGTLETDRRDIGKIRRGHLLSSLKPLQRLKESDYGSAATIVMANALSGRRKAFPESRGGSGQGIAEHGLHLQGSGSLLQGPEGLRIVGIQLKELSNQSLRDLRGCQIHSIQRTKQR
jgi:hypothetical protein